jgi:hypothetical protein
VYGRVNEPAVVPFIMLPSISTGARDIRVLPKARGRMAADLTLRRGEEDPWTLGVFSQFLGRDPVTLGQEGVIMSPFQRCQSTITVIEGQNCGTSATVNCSICHPERESANAPRSQYSLVLGAFPLERTTIYWPLLYPIKHPPATATAWGLH